MVVDNCAKLLILEIQQYLCWENQAFYHQAYSQLFTETLLYFCEITAGASKSSKLFNTTYKTLIKLYDLEFIAHVWALELFRLMTISQSSPHIILHKMYNVQKSNVNTWILIEFIENYYLKVSAMHQLFFIKHLIMNLDDDELFIKKTIHCIIRRIDLISTEKTIHLGLETYNQVDPTMSKHKLIKSLNEDKNFLNNTLSQRQKPTYQKVTLINILVKLTANHLTQFSISLTPPTVVKYLQYQVSHTSLWVNCHSFIIAKKTKDATEITEDFLNKTKNIHETAIYPCDTMCSLTKELIVADLEQTLADYTSLLEKYKVKYPGTDFSGLLKELLKKKLTVNSINQRSIQRILTSLSEVSEEVLKKGSELISAIMASSIEIAQELETNIDSTSKKHYLLQNLISKTQNLLSKLHSINTALLFLDFLTGLPQRYFYYSIYCDFRGRIYYKSNCSPQTYWYYRFLFHLGDIENYELVKNSNLVPLVWLKNSEKWADLKITDTNLQAVCLSIGLIFKNKFLNTQTGEVLISDVLDYGREIYTNHRFNSIPQWLELNWELKKVIEVLYYCNIINSVLSGKFKKYYLQKDTTCSMTQHGGKLLGYNYENLHLLNLQNVDSLFDTYQIYINELKRHFSIMLKNLDSTFIEKVEQHMVRALFKNLIMTSEYGVTHYTAYREFLQTLSEQVVDADIKEIFSKPEVFDYIYKFFTQGSTDKIFYRISKNTWISKCLSSQERVFKLNDIKIPTNYYNKTPTSLYFTISNQPRVRVSVNTFIQPTELSKREINVTKTKAALYVNAVHALDASYLRSIAYYTKLKGIPIITIHDGFCVPFFCETTLRSIANGMFFENIPVTSYFFVNNWQPDSTTILV